MNASFYKLKKSNRSSCFALSRQHLFASFSVAISPKNILWSFCFQCCVITAYCKQYGIRAVYFHTAAIWQHHILLYCACDNTDLFHGNRTSKALSSNYCSCNTGLKLPHKSHTAANCQIEMSGLQFTRKDKLSHSRSFVVTLPSNAFWSLKYCNVLKWESRITLGLNAAKITDYNKKCFK